MAAHVLTLEEKDALCIYSYEFYYIATGMGPAFVNPIFLTVKPGLFSACKQTRVEGLPIFFQSRQFKFTVNVIQSIWESYPWPGTGLESYHPEFLNWLEIIGELGRVNIRSITICGNFDLLETSYLKVLNSKLSSKAMIKLRTNETSSMEVLWIHGKTFDSIKGAAKAPTFRIRKRAYQTYEEKPLFLESDHCSLTFHAQGPWFT